MESLNAAIKIIKEKTKNVKEANKSLDDQKKEIAELEAPRLRRRLLESPSPRKARLGSMPLPRVTRRAHGYVFINFMA